MKFAPAMQFPGYTIVNGVYHPVHRRIPQQFEARYLAARTREGRVYDDAMVPQLPNLPPGHMLEQEWALRKESALRLLKYCSKKQPSTILEIGCGNGWLSHLLAGAGKSAVIGMDVNLQELEQAARVFQREHLYFLLDEITAPEFTAERFNMIVFAASIQYFPSLKNIITLAMSKLQPGGELHILDTHFYPQENIAAAQQRSLDYYTSLGVPEMANAYFHHSLEDLQVFPHQLLYNPKNPLNRLKGCRSPFPWIRLRK